MRNNTLFSMLPILILKSRGCIFPEKMKQYKTCIANIKYFHLVKWCFGFSGYPMRDAYIHGAIYDHSSDDDHSSSEEEEKHQEDEHHDDDHKIWRFQLLDGYGPSVYLLVFLVKYFLMSNWIILHLHKI